MILRKEWEGIPDWKVFDKTLYKLNFFGMPYLSDIDALHLPVGFDPDNPDAVSNGEFILILDHKRSSAKNYKEAGFQMKMLNCVEIAFRKMWPYLPCILAIIESEVDSTNTAKLTEARPIYFKFNGKVLDVNKTKIKDVPISDLRIITVLTELEKQNWSFNDNISNKSAV